MAFENLTNEEKISIIEINIRNLERQLFATLLQNGKNPDTFDVATYSEPEDPNERLDSGIITQLVNRVKHNQAALADLQ